MWRAIEMLRWAWDKRQYVGAALGALMVLIMALLIMRGMQGAYHVVPDLSGPGVVEWVLVYQPATHESGGGDSMETMPEVDDNDDGIRPMAFLFCHTLGPSTSAAWLAATRAELNVTVPSWATDFSNLRCAAGAYLDAWAAWSNGSQHVEHAPHMMRFLATTTQQEFEATWAPRVTRLLVDARGDLYMRLVVYDPVTRGMRARTVMLRSLLRVLEAYRLDRHVRLATGLAHEPCVCPAHFGIVGSGMHFTQEAEFCPQQTQLLRTRRPLLATLLSNMTGSPYRVLLNVRVPRGPVVQVDVPFREAIHGFVFAVNNHMWPLASGPRTVSVPAAPTRFDAYDPLPLFVLETVQRYDKNAKSTMLRHPLDNATIVPGTLAEDESTWLRFITRTGRRPMNRSRLLIDMPLEDTERDLVVGGMVDPSRFQSPRCVAYCAALEARLFATPASSDDDDAARPLELTDGTDLAGDEEDPIHPAILKAVGDDDEEEEEDEDALLLKLLLRRQKKKQGRP